jgi:hypothetical protein
MIEIELKRIADALEKLVESGGPKIVLQDRTTIVAPTAAAALGKQAAAEAEHQEGAMQIAGEVKTTRSRADIKQELDDLGIAYNDRLRTENLEKLLEDVKTAAGKPASAAPAAVKAPVPADVQSDFFGNEAPAPAAPKKVEVLPYTIEQGIDFAKRLAAKFGPDKTVSIIQSYGAGTVTQIAEKGKLQEFCMEVLKKEKDYEAKK